MATSKADKPVKHKTAKKDTTKKIKVCRRPSLNAILKAIEGTGGIIVRIAEKLSVSRQAVYDYIDRYDEVRQAIQNEKDTILDVCEEGLFSMIYGRDFEAIKYYLERKGKCRGYGGQDRFGKGPDDEVDMDKPESGVLVTPGLLSEDAWETAAQK